MSTVMEVALNQAGVTAHIAETPKEDKKRRSKVLPAAGQQNGAVHVGPLNAEQINDLLHTEQTLNDKWTDGQFIAGVKAMIQADINVNGVNMLVLGEIVVKFESTTIERQTAFLDAIKADGVKLPPEADKPRQRFINVVFVGHPDLLVKDAKSTSLADKRVSSWVKRYSESIVKQIEERTEKQKADFATKVAELAEQDLPVMVEPEEKEVEKLKLPRSAKALYIALFKIKDLKGRQQLQSDYLTVGFDFKAVNEWNNAAISEVQTEMAAKVQLIAKDAQPTVKPTVETPATDTTIQPTV